MLINTKHLVWWSENNDKCSRKISSIIFLILATNIVFQQIWEAIDGEVQNTIILCIIKK